MSRRMLLLVVLIPFISGCQATDESAMDQDMAASDEAAIRQMVESFDAAVRAEDIEAMMSRYSESSVRMNPNAPAAVGSAAIRELFLQGWEANDFDVTNELTDLHVANGLAAGRGTYTSRITPADGSDPYEDAGKWSSAWQKQPDGSWTTLWDIWNSDQPPRVEGQ